MEIQQLLHALFAGDEAARDTLRQMGPAAAESVQVLGEAVGSDQKKHRLDALFVLEGMGPSAAPAVPALMRALRSTDMETAVMAADVLGAVGADAVPGLVAGLADSDWRVRQGVCQALGAMGPDAKDAVEALVGRCADAKEQEEIATRAAWALGEIGEPACLEPLGKVMQDREGAICNWIAEAFAKFGRRARPHADCLRDELHRDDRLLAVACAQALLSIRTHEEAAIWTLIEVLQQADMDLRIEAAMILGECGRKAAPAIASLLAAERDPDEDLRAQASMSIAKIRPEYATQE